FLCLARDPLRFGTEAAAGAIRRMELRQGAQVVVGDVAGDFVHQLAIQIVWQERRLLRGSGGTEDQQGSEAESRLAHGSPFREAAQYTIRFSLMCHADRRRTSSWLRAVGACLGLRAFE